jgi:hypothetical protein
MLISATETYPIPDSLGRMQDYHTHRLDEDEKDVVLTDTLGGHLEFLRGTQNEPDKIVTTKQVRPTDLFLLWSLTPTTKYCYR